MNLALKAAVMESGYKQYAVAKAARIGELRLSKIICGRRQASDVEKKRLAEILERPISQIFPEVSRN